MAETSSESNLRQLEAFYGKRHRVHRREAGSRSFRPEPRGSNGIAIAPANTVDQHALLLINPHTSFYFRSELQMASEEGLNAYGAVTWGQFFVYQGFNDALAGCTRRAAAMRSTSISRP